MTWLLPSFDAGFDWLWKTSLYASVLIGLVLLIQLIFGERLPPRWRYALWLLVLLRLLMPVVPRSELSLFNLAARLKVQPTTVRVALPAMPANFNEPLSALTVVRPSATEMRPSYQENWRR